MISDLVDVTMSPKTNYVLFWAHPQTEYLRLPDIGHWRFGLVFNWNPKYGKN